MAGAADKVTFKVEWLDALASLKRYYLLQYYIMERGTNEVELFDIKNRRVFLKRTPYPAVKLSDLFLGGKITVYGRQMTIVEFGDDYTRRKMEVKNQPAFGLVPTSAMVDLGDILAAVQAAGLQVGQMKTVQLSQEDAKVLGDAAWASGPCVPLQLIGTKAQEVWAGLAERYGCFAASDAAAQTLADQFFTAGGLPSAQNSTATCRNCTLAIIKPHAVKAGALGPLLGTFLQGIAGLKVTGFEMFDIDLVAAEEFLEVYKGVLQDYSDMADELASGRLVAVELVGQDPVNAFRKVCGPRHVDVAKRILPDTLRAKYGENTIKNAVHCTDLDEDGALESEYFFRIMQGQ